MSADEPASIARAGRQAISAEPDSDAIASRCVELEKLLAQTTALGQQLEFQRNCFVQGANSALGLLRLVGSGLGTVEDRAEAMLALAQWLLETSTSHIVPIPWIGTQPVTNH